MNPLKLLIEVAKGVIKNGKSVSVVSLATTECLQKYLTEFVQYCMVHYSTETSENL